MKKTERTKKALSGLLALSLALGCLPMPAHAQEEKLSTKSFFSAMKQQEPVETPAPTEPPVPETTAPAEPTEPAVPETTAPADPTEATEPAVSEPTEATEPAIPETTAPAEPTEPQAPVVAVVSDNVAGSLARESNDRSGLLSRVVTVKIRILDGTTEIASYTRKPSTDFNSPGYNYADFTWKPQALDANKTYTLEVSYGAPYAEGYENGNGCGGVVNMWSRGIFRELDAESGYVERTLEVGNHSGLNAYGTSGKATCTFRTDNYGAYTLRIALNHVAGEPDSERYLDVGLVFRASGKEENSTQTVPSGSNITMSAETLFLPHWYDFSWTRNGVTIDGATGNTYTAPTANAGDQFVATIRRKADGNTGCTGSESWTHTVTVSGETRILPKGKTATYTGSLKREDLIDIGTAGEGFFYAFAVSDFGFLYDFDYYWNEYGHEHQDAGTYRMDYYLATDFIHGEKKGTLTFTVSKANPTLNSAPAAVTGLVYDGNVKTLLTPGSCTNGTMQYSLDNKNWSETIPTATQPGDYTVYYRVKGANKNYNDLTNASYKLNVTIAHTHELTYTAKDNVLTEACFCGHSETATLTTLQDPYTYTGADIANVASITYSENWQGAKPTNVSYTYANNRNVGTATVKTTVNGKELTKTFQITAAQLQVTANDCQVVYDAQPHGITVTAQGVDQGSAAIRYGTVEGTYDLAESPTRTEAGTTTVYYRIEQENHATVTGSKSIIIAKAAPTADLFNITLPEKAVYDGTSTFAAKVTVKDGVTGLGTAVLRYNGGVTPQAAGSYTVTAVVEEGTNYTAGEVSLGSFTVAAADNAWPTEPSIEGWTYGETCQSLNMGEADFGTPEVLYVGTTNAGVSYDSDVQPDQAGEYKAVFTVRATSDYDGLTKEVLFTVKRAAGLKAEDFTFTAPENLVYTGDVKTAGIVPKAGLTGVGAITQHVSPKAAIDVGTYTVAIDVAQGANYEASSGLTQSDWTFDIVKASAPAVVVPTATVVYGQTLTDAVLTDPTWTWVDDTIVPLNNGAHSAWLAVDDENYDYTGVAGYEDETNSVTRDLWVSVLAATPAITITTDPDAPYYDSTVSVEAKAANPYNETFTDAPVPNLLYKIGDTWAAFDGTLDLSAHTAPVGTVVSFKAVTVAEGWYAAAEKEITVTVVEKPQQTITCGEIVKTYGDKPFAMGAASNSGALSYSVSAGSDIVSIDEEGTITILNAGTAVITVTAAETAGYAQTSREFTVTVKPKTITAAPKAVSVACSTDVPALEIGYTGLVGSDSVAAKDFDLRLFDNKGQEIAPAEAMKKPGTYTIRWMNPDQVSFAELTNYVVTKVETANFVVFVPYVEEAPARKPAYVPPKIVEVAISGEEETIRVNATVKGSTATLEKVNDKQMHEVIGSHVETGTVTIDFSELKQKIDTVVLHTETIQQIAEAAHDAGNDTEVLEIKLSNDVSIEFCAESLAQKVEHAQGKDITISIIPGYKDKSLSREQKQAIGNLPSYSVIVTSGEERLTDLGGEMTIRAPYKLKYGEKPEGLVVYRVAEDGTREKCETSYDSEEKLISWKTDSLALYIIAYEAP